MILFGFTQRLMVLNQWIAISLLLTLLAELVTGYLWNRSHAASYPDVSLSYAQRKAGKEKTAKRPLIPCASSPVTRESLARFSVRKTKDLKRRLDPRTVLDSGFHAVDSGFQELCRWNMDSAFQLLEGFRIPWAAIRMAKPRIPDYTSKNFPDFGFHKQ